jgi:4-hydroxy-tetrahydrodipicolinate reductase
MTRVILVGCAGRMGQEIATLLPGRPDVKLVAGVEAAGSPVIGQKCGSGLVHDNLADAINASDAVVDFSSPDSAAKNVRLCAEEGKPFVTGVTGLTPDQTAVLREAADKVAVVWAPNFSVGVSVLTKLVAEAARMLGSGYDIEVTETHHRMKKDAPSGTARQLVDALKSATGRTEVVHGREGSVGQKPVGQIGVSSIRTGSVVGEHTVILGGPGERIELIHKAESRAAFATGVVAAILFAASARPGFYGMADVLARH